jgi:hypothetical protein
LFAGCGAQTFSAIDITNKTGFLLNVIKSVSCAILINLVENGG